MPKIVKKSLSAQKRGRPEVDSEPITVRLPRDVLAALDEARALKSAQFPPSRPEVVRFALVEWLKREGVLK